MRSRIRRILIGAVVAFAAAAPAACAQAPAAPELSGDVFVHDPAYIRGDSDEPSWIYSTGNGQVGDGNIQIRRSDDDAEWEYVGEVWSEKPKWLTEQVEGLDNLWAPELYEHDGTWYLYYAASTFGSGSSVIALATNTTLDPEDPAYEWIDQGEVISSAGKPYNAIDPNIVEDADGEPWLSFGSFSSGLQIVPLEWPSGLLSGSADPVTIADRGLLENAIEAPTIVAHDDAYYLFASRGFCCRGVDSTYEIIVGRADKVTGPYLDQAGSPLLEDGGTVVLTSEGDNIGPGGQSLSGDMLAFHWYDGAQDGMFRLGLLPVEWQDGWPAVAWPAVP
ncbi:arabinan endo-1,5-alpha-L-arabinosidase [Microbacterium sorbitolivorans]|uniref:arabinan endo-1,5-alpha-L-arabinosidase n=1 Tax=Microbacterium sorbitolivorans TaxID=1867410 RepID=UPI0016513A5C|nr:arabinan endo-1,5-alpha-L-arabinosidase [Microbacterium sorbitolivorans]GGF48375.1 arabinan endo-1,5-alpha-L-arabinosidase [Microbacterium sorbitolivorans]